MYKVKKDLCPLFMMEIFTYEENDKFARPNIKNVGTGENRYATWDQLSGMK